MSSRQRPPSRRSTDAALRGSSRGCGRHGIDAARDGGALTCDRIDFRPLAGTAIEPFLGRARSVWVYDDSSTGATPDVGRTLTLHADRRVELRVEHHASYWGPAVELDVTVRGRWELLAVDAVCFALRILEPTYEVGVGSEAAVAGLRREVATCELRGSADALWFETPR